MMTSWVRLTVLAWVTAVLAVTPVQAALSCRICCVKLEPVASAAVTVPSCCQNHSSAAVACRTSRSAIENRLGNERPCQQCPQCERARPIPVAPIPASPSLMDIDGHLMAAVVPSAMVNVPAIKDTVRNVSAAASPPQICALLCRWLT